MSKINNLTNYSNNHLISQLPRELLFEKVIFLPDFCPGKSQLPTGTVINTKQEDWRKFAVSDVGCGMRLLESDVTTNDFTEKLWNEIAELLILNKNKLGDLGGGNHFLDALESYSSNKLYFLVHTGSRNESGLVDSFINSPSTFDLEFNRSTMWAKDNRTVVQEVLEKIFGKMKIILDKPHNTYEILSDGSVIIRKGAVKISNGELAVIPSHMEGDVALIKAGNKISELLNSMCHGTGRKVPRGESKNLSLTYDYDELRKKIIIPDCVKNSSMKTEISLAYRDLDQCLEMIKDYITVVERFRVIAYMGHL